MRANNLYLFLPFLLFLNTSCLENETTTTELTFNDILLDIPFKLATNIQNDTNLSARNTRTSTSSDFYTFSGSLENLDLKHEVFTQIEKYKDYPMELFVDNIVVLLKIEDDAGSFVKQVKMEAVNSENNLIAVFTSNRDIYANESYIDADLTIFLDKVLQAIILNKQTVNLFISGETDIDPAILESSRAGIITIQPEIRLHVNLKGYTE